MSEFRKAQYSEDEKPDLNFEDQSFEINETKIPDEDPDNKVEAPEPELSVEVPANEPEPNAESGQEIASLSEAARQDKIIAIYGGGDWKKTSYDGGDEYKFNKAVGLMEKKTATGEVENVTQSIQGEKEISLHHETLQAFNNGEIHVQSWETTIDNRVVLEVFVQWAEADGRIRSETWTREIIKPELPEAEDGSDDEGGGGEDESVGSIDEIVPDNTIVTATESTTKTEVVIEMGADWEDEADGGSEEDNSVSNVQGFGFQTQSAKVVENSVVQAGSLKSVDTLQARLVESANFHEATDVSDDALRNKSAKDTEAVVLEKKDSKELVLESDVDKDGSFVESINLFGEPVVVVESVNEAVSTETIESADESENYAEDIVVEQTVVRPASVEAGDMVIDMDEIWEEVRASSESYEVDRELSIVEQPNNVVSEQEVVSHEFAIANESKEESVKKVEFAGEETNLATEQNDANFAGEQITNTASTEVFGQSVEISTQSTEGTPVYETTQEVGSIIQMFEHQKENSFELNQDKNVELGSIEQSSDVKSEEIINVTEEVPAVESFEYDGVQKVVAEASTTETAIVINLADYWEKDTDVKNDNKLNVTEQPAAVSFEQKIITSEPSVAVEQVQSVAESKPAKVTVEQGGPESDVVEAANIINMATYWREKNQNEADSSVLSFEAQPVVLNMQKEQLNTSSNSYVPVADEILAQDGAREIELIQQAA